MTHLIKELSFGDPMKGAKLPANFEPLQVCFNYFLKYFNKFKKGQSTQGKDPMASHDYTLKIVPTVYTDISKKTRFGYQYTAVYKGI